MNTKFLRVPFLAAILGGALSLPTSQAEADALDNWTTNQVSTNHFGLNCVVHRIGHYVAYGGYSDYGVIITSENGINWTAKNTGITNLLGKASAADRVFMARAGSYLATSTDGTNWVQYAPMLPGTSAVASDGSRLVTVGCTLILPGFNYNSHAYLSDVLVGIHMTNAIPPQVVLSGLNPQMPRPAPALTIGKRLPLCSCPRYKSRRPPRGPACRGS